jgi:YVTN family beta-propeller protein
VIKRNADTATTALAIFALLVLVSSSQPLAHAQQVVATAKDGGSAYAIAYDPAKSELFVANYLNDTVTVISDSSNAVVATLKVGAGPDALAYDSGKGEVFVTNSLNGTVTVLSDANNAVVATVPVGLVPQGLAYDPAKGEVFVSFGGNTASSIPSGISVISDATNSVVATIAVNQTAQVEDQILTTNLEGVAYDSGKGEVFVANYGLDSVLVISDSNNSVVATVPVGSYPFGLAYDSGKGEVFVANSNSNFTTIISDATNKVISNVTVGEDPGGVAYDPSSGQVYVTNAEGTSYVDGTYNGTSDGTVSIISDATNSVVGNVTVGIGPGGIAYDSGKNEVVVLNVGSDTLSVISEGSAATSTTTTSKTSNSLAILPSYLTIVALNIAIVGILASLAFTKRRGRLMASPWRP